MWITRLSPIVVGCIVLGYLVVFVALPNILVRTLVHPGLIRPTFLVAAETSLLVIVILGLYGEGSKQFYDIEYRNSNGRMQKFILVAILSVIFIASSVPIVAQQASDLVAVYARQVPLREVTAVIKYREGLAMTFRCRQECGGNWRSAGSENLNIACQAARSIG